MTDLMGSRMRLIRAALGLSEQQGAEACQVTVKTYRRYEAGAQVRTSAFLNFGDKLNISFDYLLLGDTTRLGRHLQITRSKVAILKA
jgi:transcriptional regulator with XRE-family HTH domain